MPYLLFVFAYLLGSIPSGYLIARYFYGVDIMKKGSGNIGFTNVTRVIGFRAGILTLFLDALKGAFPAYLARFFYPDFLSYLNQALIVALVFFCAVFGHSFSIFLKFKGGRGVATAAGVLLVLFPQVFLILLIVFALVLAIFRYVSLSSITVALLFPVLVFLFYPANLVLLIFSLILSSLVIIKHIPNIRRLLKGEEPKIGRGAEN